MSVLGERIRELMDERVLSQREVAEVVGITDVTMSRVLSGERTPKGPIIVNFANFFGVSTDYLLGVTDEKKPYKARKDTICDMHEIVLAICSDQLENLPPEPMATEEYIGVYQAFRDISEATEKAKEAGERMENRLIQYSEAIKSLGFERVIE